MGEICQNGEVVICVEEGQFMLDVGVGSFEEDFDEVEEKDGAGRYVHFSECTLILHHLRYLIISGGILNITLYNMLLDNRYEINRMEYQ